MLPEPAALIPDRRGDHTRLAAFATGSIRLAAAGSVLFVTAAAAERIPPGAARFPRAGGGSRRSSPTAAAADPAPPFPQRLTRAASAAPFPSYRAARALAAPAIMASGFGGHPGT